MSIENQAPEAYTKELAPIPIAGLYEKPITVCYTLNPNGTVYAEALDFPSAYTMHRGIGVSEQEATESLYAILRTSHAYSISIAKATGEIHGSARTACERVLAQLETPLHEEAIATPRLQA